MTNIDRAAEVVYDTLSGKYGDFCQHEEVGQALADAGLLAPDLPEANDTELPLPTKTWVLDAEGSPVVWTGPGCYVMIQRIEPGDLTPAQARTFALNVLAAADYCEGELDAVD